jgi:hypothetical protein
MPINFFNIWNFDTYREPIIVERPLIFAIADQIILAKLNFAKIGSDIRKNIIMKLFALKPFDSYNPIYTL